MKKISQQGFTILEMGFVLILWGGMMALLFSIYAEYRNRIVLMETVERLQLNAEAVTSFQNTPKRFPCPSMPGLPETDPQYGQEMCAAAAALAMGTCDRGLCRVPAARDADNDPATIDSVYIGGVPFISMQVSAEAQNISNLNAAKRRSSYDGWGGGITYAVSANLTDETLFDNNHGGISVVTEFGDSVVEPVGSADFVLISHGEDRKGAYTQEYVLGTPCAGTGRDLSNCLHDDAEFVNSLIYKKEGATYYDDYVYVYQAAIDGIWKEDGGQIYYKGTGNLGIGVPNPLEKLDVDGTVYSDTLQTGNLCDSVGADCFRPELFGGILERETVAGNLVVKNRDAITGESPAGMGCDNPNTTYAVGISENKLVCTPTGYTPGAVGASCPAGQFLSGFDSVGAVICVSPP